MRRRLVGLVVLLAVSLAVFLRSGHAHATPFDVAGADWEGCGELIRLARAELGASRVIATAQIDYSTLTADDGLIILYPEHSLDVDELSKMMHAGGRVVLLDDYGRGDSLLRHFDIQRIPSPKRPVESLRHNPNLAIAEPASPHPVVAEVTRVVTNHPTGLSAPKLSPVLQIRAEGEPDVLVAIAGQVVKGRLLVVGDPSIVMNAMLRYAGNKAFARGLVRYAVDADSWGKRGGKLYIVSGKFVQKGSFGGEDSPLNEALRALKDAIESIRKDGLPPGLAWALAVALGFALVVWVGSRAGRLHRPIKPRFIRKLPTVAHGGVAGHAAVIGAAQTSRVLAVLELKSALEEQLSTLLGLDKVPPQQELLQQLGNRGLLDSEGLSTLSRLLLRMGSAETMVVFQRSGGMVQPIRDNEVVSIGRTVKQILDTAEANAMSSARSAVLGSAPLEGAPKA